PDLAAREGILKLYAKRMKLADDVDLRVVAQRTAGLVGADLENICNEAAIIALRRNKQKVDMSDFEAAIDRVLTGPEAKQRSLSAEERHRVAVHESGHTLVAFAVPHGQPVHKVTIIPRAIGALGFTLQLPTEDRYLSTKQEMLDQIAVLLGGKEAERLVLGDVSSGAANDLEKATEIARTMVTRFGMSENLCPVVYGKQQQLPFLNISPVTEERNYSEETARAIDEEIRNIIENQQKRAARILEDCRGALEALTAALEEKETLSGDEVRELLKSCNFEVSGERT
ncbi:MAG: cell division protein FtsH, partial [Deltaproteobacteria bacterium]